MPEVFRHSCRVYYEDTDAGGIVYHARYLHFAERARTECLRALGVTAASLLAQHGVLIAVKALTMDFRAPAVLDDLLAVDTGITHIGGASLDLQQDIRLIRRDAARALPPALQRGDEPELVRLTVKAVAIAPDGALMRLPASLRRALGATPGGAVAGTMSAGSPA